MRRIGIFVFYDYEGVVDKYIEFLLKSIEEVVSELLIVVNGKLTNTSEETLRRYSRHIFRRNNYGFDGGAYKDAVLKYISQRDWKKWDEVLLFNDTFYGPFFSLKELFRHYEQKDVDFWGLSKYIGGESKLLGKVIPEHIQAYFLVVKKRLLHSEAWKEFWEDLSYPDNYKEAIEKFEVAFTQYFANRGFRYSTWLDEQGAEPIYEESKVIYNSDAYKLIREYSFPILKRKAINLSRFVEISLLMEYIEELGYDVSLIWQHIHRLEIREKSTPFSFVELDNFYKLHENVFIFGHGKISKTVEAYYEYRKWKISGFVVSKKGADETEICLDELELDTNDGIVVALGRDNLEQVKGILQERFRKQQLHFPVYDS